MSNSTELLLLRLGLTGVIFLFVLVTALTMRSGLRVRRAAPAPNRAVRGPRLVVVAPGQTGLTPGTEIAVAGEMLLGRDPGNGIVLGDASVSGTHARLQRVRDGWRLADLGSTNGTLVEGRPLDGRGVLLHGGERVSLGTVVLRFQA